MAENIRFDITARDETARAFRAVDARMNQMTAGLKMFRTELGSVRNQLFAVSAAAAAVVYLEKRFVELGSAIGDTADKIGVTAEELQALRYAGKLAGVETETLDSALMVFTRNLGQAQMGLGNARKALGELGIGLDDIRNKGPAELFDLVAARIGRIEDPLKRNALLAQIFGRAGVQLSAMLKDVGGSVDDLAEQYKALGLIVSNDVIRRNQEAGDAFDTIGLALQSAGMNMSAGFLPALKTIEDIVTSQQFQDGVRDAAAGISEFVQAAIRDQDKLLKTAEIIGRLWVASKGARAGALVGAVGGPAGSAIGAGVGGLAGYFAPEIIEGGMNVGGGALDPNSTLGKNVLSVDVTQPNNMAEILAYRNRKPAVGRGGAGDAWDGSTIDWEEQDKTAKAIAEVTRNLENELGMLGMSNRQREIYNNLLRAGTDESTAAGQKIAALTGQLYDQKQAIEDAAAAQAMFANIAYDAFDSLILQGESLSDVLDNMTKALMQAALQAALLGEGPLAGLLGGKGDKGAGGVLGLIAGAIGSAFGGGVGGGTGGLYAKGGVFDMGAPVRFAAGGVVTSPMLFPMAKGTGLMGEAGPEGILPLARSRDGRLGVIASGGAPVNVTVNNSQAREVDVQTRSERGPDGERIVIDIVRRAQSRGDFDGANRARYGVTRPKVRG